MIRVRPSRTCQLSHEARFLACAADRSRFVLAADDGRYSVVDAQLSIVHEGDLPCVPGGIDLYPGSDVLAIASRSELVVATMSGTTLYRRVHRAWSEGEGGDVAFLDDGSRILAICPTEDGAVILVVEPDTGRILSEHPFEGPEPCAFHLIRLPFSHRWGLWTAAGQDGQWTYWLSASGEQISVEQVQALNGKDHGPIEFHPSGTEFLVSADGGLERYTFPEVKLIGRVEPPGDGDFSFSETVCYVGPQRALATDSTSSRIHVVDLATMTLEDEVLIAGHEPRPFAELYPHTRSSDRSLCTDLWYLRSLPRAAIMTVHGSPKRPQTVALLEGPPLFTLNHREPDSR